jgi:hypothetical protein
MRIERNRLYAVLTGDIVDSSKLKDRQRVDLHKAMVSTSEELRVRFGKIVPLSVDIYRGDSWQFIISDPAKSLRIGLFYRSHVRAKMESKRIDTRVAIGIGSIDFLPGNKASRGDGEAFRISGGALEKLSRNRRMILECSESIGSLDVEALDVIFQLIDVLARDWTGKQAKAISGALLGLTQEKVASSWFEKSISQQAVAQHLDRSGWNAVASSVEYFETTVKKVT